MPQPDHENPRLRHYSGRLNVARRWRFASVHLCDTHCAHETLNNRQNWTVLRPRDKPWTGKAFVGFDKEGQPEFHNTIDKYRQAGSGTPPRKTPAPAGSLSGIVAALKILIVLGNSGCGKTVMNAALVQHLSDASDDEDGTIWHFCFVFGKFETYRQFAQVVGEDKVLLIEGVDTEKHEPKMQTLRAFCEHALKQQRALTDEHGVHTDGTPKHRIFCPLDDLAELVKRALTTRGKGAWLPDFLNKVRESGLLICIFLQPTCMSTFTKLLEWQPNTITMWMGDRGTAAGVNQTGGEYTAAELAQVLDYYARDPAAVPPNQRGMSVLQYTAVGPGETGRRVELFKVVLALYALPPPLTPTDSLHLPLPFRRSTAPWPTGARPSRCPAIGSLPPRAKTAPEKTRTRTASSPSSSRRLRNSPKKRRTGWTRMPTAWPTARTTRTWRAAAAASLPPPPQQWQQAPRVFALSSQTATPKATSPWASTRFSRTGAPLTRQLDFIPAHPPPPPQRRSRGQGPSQAARLCGFRPRLAQPQPQQPPRLAQPQQPLHPPPPPVEGWGCRRATASPMYDASAAMIYCR
jgi:hypothetical protein